MDVYRKTTKIKKSKKGGYKVILTKEIQDRDGQIIKVDGIDVKNYLQNPVLIDSHIYYDSIDRIIGRVESLEKTADKNGTKMLVGSVVFADTERGKLAKSLVDNDFLKGVSIGFGNTQWDGNTCVSCELYEVSLVSIPANTGALIQKYFNPVNDLDKKIKLYEEYKKIIKTYRRFLMSRKLWDMLNLAKTGDEINDIINLYEKIKQLSTSNYSADANENREHPDNHENHDYDKAEDLRAKLYNELLNRLKNYL